MRSKLRECWRKERMCEFFIEHGFDLHGRVQRLCMAALHGAENLEGRCGKRGEGREARQGLAGWEAFHFLGDFRQTRRFRHIGAAAVAAATDADVDVASSSCAPCFRFRFRFQPLHPPRHLFLLRPPTSFSSPLNASLLQLHAALPLSLRRSLFHFRSFPNPRPLPAFAILRCYHHHHRHHYYHRQSLPHPLPNPRPVTSTNFSRDYSYFTGQNFSSSLQALPQSRVDDPFF